MLNPPMQMFGLIISSFTGGRSLKFDIYSLGWSPLINSGKWRLHSLLLYNISWGPTTDVIILSVTLTGCGSHTFHMFRTRKFRILYFKNVLFQEQVLKPGAVDGLLFAKLRSPFWVRNWNIALFLITWVILFDVLVQAWGSEHSTLLKLFNDM